MGTWIRDGTLGIGKIRESCNWTNRSTRTTFYAKTGPRMGTWIRDGTFEEHYVISRATIFLINTFFLIKHAMLFYLRWNTSYLYIRLQISASTRPRQTGIRVRACIPRMYKIPHAHIKKKYTKIFCTQKIIYTQKIIKDWARMDEFGPWMDGAGRVRTRSGAARNAIHTIHTSQIMFRINLTGPRNLMTINCSHIDFITY
jgi:hypothetical protein